MAGLLDFLNNEDGRFGLGLLAAAGPRADRMGVGGRVQLAMQGQDARRQEGLKSGLLSQQLEQNTMMLEKAKRESANQAGLDALMPQYFQPGNAGSAGTAATNGALPSDLQMGAMPATPPRPAQFDIKGYTSAAVQSGLMNPMDAIKMQQSMTKDAPINKLDAKDFTPASIAKFSQTNNYGDLEPRVKLEFVEGVGVNPYDSKNINRSIPNPNKPFQIGADGKPIANLPYQQYEIGKASAGASRTTNQLINAGPRAFDTELGKLDAKQLDEWRSGAIAAKNTILTAKKLDDAAASGAYSGGAANLKMTLGSYLNGLTGTTPKGQVGSELYTAEANNLILSQIKQLGANPSNADLAFIQKTVPQLTSNADARKQLTQFMREKAQSSISLYQRADSHARKNSGLGGFQDMPANEAPPAPAAPAMPTATMRYNVQTGKLEKVN